MVPSINKIQSKASDVESDQTMRLAYRKQVADPIPNLYDSYMNKRDARLRESCDSNGAKKEARMKAMNDSLERHSTEMKATFSAWFEDRHNSVSSAQRRAENPKSFNARSALKREDPQDFKQLQDDGDLSGLGLLRNIQGKKLFVRTPIPRSAIKLTSTSRKRRTQLDNPFAQSVLNFSDLQKVNTKPYFAASKIVARSRLRNYTHSRSNNNEEMPSVKEDKS
ncbi:hypothetical protein Tco_0592640 [Tanacetum coccineum]